MHTKKTDAEQPKTGLAKARQKAVQVLGKNSPRARGEVKTKAALEWIYRWGFSSSGTLENLCGTTRSGLAARLEKNGLITSTRTESGGGVKSIPASILTLTSLGLEVHEANETSPTKYVLDPYKINQKRLRHDQIIQLLTLKLINQKRCLGYQTERQLSHKSEPGIKQPDCTWVLSGEFIQKKVGVEVELSQKWARELDTFVRDTLLSVQPPEASKSKKLQPRFESVLIYCGAPAILKNYKAAFAPGADLKFWGCDETRHWKVTEVRKIPLWSAQKVGFFLIDLDKPIPCDFSTDFPHIEIDMDL